MDNQVWMCKRNGVWCSSDKSIDSDEDIGWVEVQSAKGHTIAMVTDDGGGYTLAASDKEMERRANLIAAAPDLAKHVKALIDSVMERYGLENTEQLTCPHMQGLAKALAKAMEGEG